MKYFLDTEFSERGSAHPITLLSIGIIAEDGRQFYAINADAEIEDCNEWVKNNVLPNLKPSADNLHQLQAIAARVKQFIGDDKPEFWGYYADYDWVAFCQMFGTMMDLPKGWPMYCRDIKQLCDEEGNPQLPKQQSAEHNALNDAQWNMEAWKFLSE